MTTRTKTILIITGTFILGALVGGLINGAMIRHRMNRIAEMQTRRGFAQVMIHIIQPSKKQLTEIKPILDKTAQELIELNRQRHLQAMTIADSMRVSLNPYLTVEQKDRLLRHMRRFRREHEKHFKMKQPPPPSPKQCP